MTVTQKARKAFPTPPQTEYKIDFDPAETAELKKLLGYKPAEFVPVKRLFNELANTLKAATAKASGQHPQQTHSCDVAESELQQMRDAAGVGANEPIGSVLSKAFEKAKGVKLQLSRSSAPDGMSAERYEQLLSLAGIGE